MSDVAFQAWHEAALPLQRAVQLRAVSKAATAVALSAGFAFAALAYCAIPTTLSVQEVPATPAPPAWREILKPVRIYSLQAAALGSAPATYTARAHNPGGGREDTLTFGQFQGDRPAMRLRIFRRGTESATGMAMHDAIAGEAAALGLDVLRVGRLNSVPTRLGRFDVADVGLRLGSGMERPCAGFRFAIDHPALSIAGLACGRRDAMTQTEVGCLLERLDVASARDDRELIDFFAASELRRNAACAGMRLGPDGLHAPWLDEKPVPVKTQSDTISGKPATGRRTSRRH